MDKIALFPGSFDPFTIGHSNIMGRALALFDKVVIGVGINENKRTLYSVDERVAQIRAYYEGENRVEVVAYDDLTIDLARRVGARYIVRGIRSVKDFEYERDIAATNQRLGGVETVLLFTEPQYAFLSSSIVRELIGFGKDVSEFLPKEKYRK